jgi:pimeloyl-ACP methyl ester carboxylesterase
MKALLVTTLALGALAPPATAQVRPPVTTQAALLRGCPARIAAWWQQHAKGGRIACASDPTRPAILLVHGLHQDAQTWTAPSYVEYAYDRGDDPGNKRIGDRHSSPNAGIYKIGTSSWLYGGDRKEWDRSVNWFDYLAAQGYTVATWSQPGLTFSTAFPTALEAFDSLLSQTTQLSPTQPPVIALIGHSRGGLLIRRVLKDRPNTNRVQTVVTLHSPHQGSALAATPGRVVAETVDLIDCCVPGDWTAAIKNQAKDVVVEAMRPFTKLVWPDENRELMPDGPLIRSLRENEKPISGVRYYTFGGTNPTYYKMYVWLFDATSSVPQFAEGTMYFVWRVKPIEIGPLSPIMDALRDFVAEVKPGHGDGLVTDASARLPFSTHETTNLNHAEVLWNRPLQQRVARLIGTSRPALKASGK